MSKRSKRVLIISYHWPPSGGISVLRSLKIAKYLSIYGWEPVVYTVDDAQYQIIDERNFKDVPENTTILKKGFPEPFEIFKKLTGRSKRDTLQNIFYVNEKKNSFLDRIFIWIRANFFIPDARSMWIRPSIKFLTRYLTNNPVDAIFSDGPPHTNTLIACRISKKFGIPWLMDMQDPWTQVDYYKDFKMSRYADKKHRKLEQECFNQAQKTTIVTKTWKEDLEAIGAHNVSDIPWGYDEDDYVDVKPELTNSFTITHVGTLGTDRLPETLLKILGEICLENESFRKDLRLQFIGAIDQRLITLLKSHGLYDQSDCIQQVPRKQALEYTFNTQVLLLILNRADNNKGRMPGKLFEYLRSARPILCLGPTESDVNDILVETKSGWTIDYDDEVRLKENITQLYSEFKSGGIQIHQKNIDQYSMAQLFKKISDYLNEITTT